MRERRRELSSDEFELEFDELFELHGSDEVFVLVLVEVLVLVLPAQVGVANASTAPTARLRVSSFIGCSLSGKSAT